MDKESAEKDSGSLAGQVLIATPAIGDPRFDRTVVFICAHDEQQTMGLILNQAMGDLSLSDLMEQLGIETDMARPDRIVLAGGPVDRERGFVLHSNDYECDDATLPVRSDIRLTATKEILLDIAADRGPQQSILALGYAGWGPGQLEEEIRENAWLVCDPNEELVFSETLETKWESALNSIGVDPAKLSSIAGMA